MEAPFGSAQTTWSAGAGISCLAVLTARRPVELKRALQSYCAAALEYGHAIKVLIADGSSSSADGQETKAIVAAMSAKGPLGFCYAGKQEKAEFANNLLTMCAVPPEVLKFGMFGSDDCGTSTGANRNTILLHTVGQLILSVDDDSVCTVGTLTSKATNHTLTLGGKGDDAAFWLFPDRASALEAMKPLTINLFTEHERLLGKSLANLRGEYDEGDITLRNLCSHLLESLARTTGNVGLTFSGVIGDSGMHSAGRLAMHRGPGTRRRVVSYGQTYGDILTCREIGRQWLSSTICHVSAPMTTATGMDNRALLPPFFPICRGQDEIFCATIKRCLPHAYFGHVPSTLLHLPANARENHLEWASAIRMSDLILESVKAWPEPAGSDTVSERMMSLGHHLTAMGKLHAEDFDQVFRSLLQKKAQRILGKLEALLMSGESGPDFCRRALEHQRERLQISMRQPEKMIPYDLALEMPMERMQPIVQTLLIRFGQLLSWWPSMIAAARSLAARGIQPGQYVK